LQTYWKQILYQASALKILALKIFAIRSQSAEIDQLFSYMVVHSLSNYKALRADKLIYKFYKNTAEFIIPILAKQEFIVEKFITDAALDIITTIRNTTNQAAP
ncbi:14179_t:CDS:2, partial [Gigaspora margarita]